MKKIIQLHNKKIIMKVNHYNNMKVKIIYNNKLINKIIILIMKMICMLKLLIKMHQLLIMKLNKYKNNKEILSDCKFQLKDCNILHCIKLYTFFSVLKF